MKSFAELYEIAVERKGVESLQSHMPEPRSPAELAAIGDDRYLAQMAQRVFSAGFVWRVVEAKWPGFEEAFEGFVPEILAEYLPDALEALAQDTRIIRNKQKIAAVMVNARFVMEVSAEHGGFGNFVAQWPSDDIVGLWKVLDKRGSRLGGATGPMFLRFMGKDTFMLTRDVVARLIAEGVIDKAPTSQKARAAVQDVFNGWAAESGRPLSQVSRILASTIDAPPAPPSTKGMRR